MIVIINGLTSAGKSYIANYLESKLKKKGYSVVHASDLFRQLLSNEKLDYKKTKMNTGWYDKSNIDSKRKVNSSLDKKLDNYLLDLIKDKDNLIICSRTMPCLSKKGIKVWIGASLEERTKRLSLRDKISKTSARKIIKAKDDFSIKQYKKIYGFDLNNLDVYDIIIDTTNLSIKQAEAKAYKYVKLFLDKAEKKKSK
ncbi:MAG: cytidylate kinase family protein [archaeon]